jgi:methylglyoxal/glyoxal reductase
LGKGQILNHPIITQIASTYKKTPPQILLRWSLERGVITIPRATTESHVIENLEIFNFVLSPEDHQKLSNLHCNLRVTWNPEGVS